MEQKDRNDLAAQELNMLRNVVEKWKEWRAHYAIGSDQVEEAAAELQQAHLDLDAWYKEQHSLGLHPGAILFTVKK